MKASSQSSEVQSQEPLERLDTVEVHDVIDQVPDNSGQENNQEQDDGDAMGGELDLILPDLIDPVSSEHEVSIIDTKDEPVTPDTAPLENNDSTTAEPPTVQEETETVQDVILEQFTKTLSELVQEPEDAIFNCSGKSGLTKAEAVRYSIQTYLRDDLVVLCNY